MQQYFVNRALVIGEEYIFDREQAHHAGNVVRLNHEKVRLVYQGKAYFAEGYKRGGEFVAKVLEEDDAMNELSIDITLAVALIRREKFEFVLQKATEMGVKKIVPFESSFCVVKSKKEKSDRWRSIVKEASEQCKRNIIPEITETISFKQLSNYKSESNVAAYENAYGTSRYLSQAAQGSSMTVVIGPEGGFSPAELKQLNEMGYESITLGNRILRAETAALYAMAVLGELAECR